jgi:carboxymethylenebutenolidase
MAGVARILHRAAIRSGGIMDITTERVSIPVPGSSAMPAYLARPKTGGRHPAVIVWMEIFGVNSHVRDVAERVAREGYVAVAPNFFHRTAPDIEVGYDEAGMAAGIKEMGKLDADQMIADAKAAVTWLRARPDVAGKIGVTGFCIGGHMSYLTAAETDVAAAASFYGGGIAAPQGPGGKPSPIQRTNKITGRVLALFGAKDGMISQTQVEQIRTALREHSVKSEIVVYPDADHGFFCDQRATFHAASAKDAWERVKKLFAAELR